MSGFDTGWGTLDRVLETGTSIYSDFLTGKTAKNNAMAAQAVATAEQARADQLGILGKTTTVGNINFPNWAIPLGLGGVALLWYLKKK
jgi:hypothetical protein